MLSVSHAATGAFIASKLPHPLLYIPLAIGLHFLEDWIPHWDAGTGLTNGNRTRRAAFVLGLIDLFAAAGLVYFFWQAGQTSLQTHVWVGALAALSPDLVGAPKMFLGIEFKFMKKFHAFHEYVHTSTPQILIGLLPQALLIGVIWFLR
jgi:hypothetical protein